MLQSFHAKTNVKEIEVNLATAVLVYSGMMGLSMRISPAFSNFGKNYTRRAYDDDLFLKR